MRKLKPRIKALCLSLSVTAVISRPLYSEEIRDKEWIYIGDSYETEKVYIKNIKKIGKAEFAYQDSNNNMILVKCGRDQTMVRLWYYNTIGSEESDDFTKKMQWHRAADNSKIDLESTYICDN